MTIGTWSHLMCERSVHHSRFLDGRRSRVASIDLLPVRFCGMELSNQFLLGVAAFSFLAFVIAEVIGALAGNSLSLLGDAAAMSVDVFTVL